jgi:rhodanese-related sulfurtransferase
VPPKRERGEAMADILRVSAEEAHSKVSKSETLLVCAYEDPSSYQSMHLEGAISIQEFRTRVSSLDKEREIIFYCA